MAIELDPKNAWAYTNLVKASGLPRVELGESLRQAVEHLIDKRADQAQRMIRANTPFDVNST